MIAEDPTSTMDRPGPAEDNIVDFTDERITRIEEKLELANQQLVTLINYVEELLPYARRAAVMMENNPVVKLREAFRGRR